MRDCLVETAGGAWHRKATLAAVLLLALGLAACVAGKQAPRPRVEYGFNDTAGPMSYRLQTELGIPVRRMLVGWNQVQPTSQTWDWSQSDIEYADLSAAHLRPLLVAVAPPCWAHPSDPCSGVDLGATPPDPAYDGAWSEFVGRLAARYPAAVGIEIWNEENLAAAFLPHPDPDRYAQLVKEAYRAVKRVNRTMPVIAGGLFASAVSGPAGIGDAQFLHGMYAGGAKDFMDGIGIHIYPTAGTAAGDVDEMETDLNALRAVRDAADDSAMPIWITEVGVSTQPTGERGQAADLVAIVKRLKRDRDVRAVIIHRLIDPTVTTNHAYGGSEPGYGMFRADGTPKRVACALSRTWHAALRC